MRKNEFITLNEMDIYKIVYTNVGCRHDCVDVIDCIMRLNYV